MKACVCAGIQLNEYISLQVYNYIVIQVCAHVDTIQRLMLNENSWITLMKELHLIEHVSI